MENSESGTTIIKGLHYSTGQPVKVEILDGQICKISGIDSRNEHAGDLYLAPGFIDNQINGYSGIDFSGSDINSDDVIKASGAILKDGTTTFLPTLITADLSTMTRSLKVLCEAWEKDELFRAAVPGFHLEGPYISPEEGFRGCHPIEFIRKPSVDEFRELQEISGNRIIQITLAPEAEGAMELIKYCVSAGIVVAMGHTRASASQIKMAVDLGVKLSTHLGNGCANTIHRHNNPLWPQLADERLTPSIIADGHHLLPEEIKVFYKVKGAGNIILTSDVVYLSGMAPGKYFYLGTEVQLTESGMLLDVRHNCLAGASYPVKKGVETIMDYTGCSLSEAVNMATLNVAGVLNLSDRGTIAEGKRADLILFEKKGNRISIRKTYLAGKLVYDSGDSYTTFYLPNNLNWG
jgi:N-acetylglucosamine-6-phosphate deacetylase